MTTQETRPSTSRRSVLRAAAWTAPVVVATAAAPAASASGATVLTPAQTGTSVFAGQPGTVAVRLTAGGAPVVGQAVQFTVAGGYASLSQSSAVTDSDGVASIQVTPRTATATVNLTASTSTASTALTVLAKRPQLTITPTAASAAGDVLLTLSGTGFLGTTATGNAYGAGLYATAWLASKWSDETPLTFDYLAVKYAAAPGISADGTFSGLTFTVPGSALTKGESYAIAVSAAHQYSANPQFNAHAIFTAQ